MLLTILLLAPPILTPPRGDPRWSRARCDLAGRKVEQHLDAGRVEEGWALLTELRDRCPLRGYELVDLGRRLERCGEGDRAQDLYREVLDRYPEDLAATVARIALADRLLLAGDLDAARSAYRAIGLDRPGVANRVADLELRLGRFEEAVRAWEEAAASSRSAAVRDHLTRVLRMAGRPGDALAVLRGSWEPRLVGCMGDARDDRAHEAFVEAEGLTDLGRRGEALSVLAPHLEHGRLARRLWVEIHFLEGRLGAGLASLPAPRRPDEPPLERFGDLLAARAGGDVAPVWEAWCGRGPAATACWALEALLEMPGAEAWARAHQETADDLAAVALLVELETPDAPSLVGTRLAAAATGAREDGPSLALPARRPRDPRRAGGAAALDTGPGPGAGRLPRPRRPRPTVPRAARGPGPLEPAGVTARYDRAVREIVLLALLATGVQDPAIESSVWSERYAVRQEIGELLDAGRVDTAWERILDCARDQDFDGDALRWADSLRWWDADERADELLEEVARTAQHEVRRVKAVAKLAEGPAHRGEFCESVRALREIGAEHPAVAQRLAHLERERGRPGEALRVLRGVDRADAHGVAGVVLKSGLVAALVDLGREEEALALHREAWGRMPEFGCGIGAFRERDALLEARLLLALGDPPGARIALTTTGNRVRGVLEAWVESLRMEGGARPGDPVPTPFGERASERARVVAALFDLHDRGDLAGLWRAGLQLGPLGDEPDVARRLFLRTPGAAGFAQGELAGRDDRLALALLAQLGEDVVDAVEPRLAAARDGLRDDGPALLHVLAVQGTPAARAALWRWTADPVLGTAARRVSLRYSPFGRVEGSRAWPLD